MKTHIQVSKSFHFLLVATLLLALAGLLFTACEKETVYIEVPIEVPVEFPVDTCNRPDEVNDLIAFLHPLHGALFVLPAYVDISLAELNAQPTSDGQFAFFGINPEGEPREIIFHVEVVDALQLQPIAQEVDATNPDLIKEFSEQGTSYRLYKNAKCGTAQAGFEGPCDERSDGTSTKNIWYASSKCERGTGFCTEGLTVMGKKVTYLNAGCQGVIKSEESYFGWQCQ